MESLFNMFAGIIVFFHVISAVIWVGGMIVIRFAVHYSMASVNDPMVKIGRQLETLDRFFKMVLIVIVLLLLTAIVMILGLGFKGTDLYSVVIIKEVIWVIMTVMFILIYKKRNRAQEYFDRGDMKAAKETLIPLAQWMIPVNIVLGMVAIYLGITLRGF